METILSDERRTAARALLRHPLVTSARPSPDLLPIVKRHQQELTRWFANHLGYRLVVEPDLARLYKSLPPRPRRRRMTTPGGRPFSSRHYSLMCLVLAVLERGDAQMTLSQVAEQVRIFTLADPELASLDLDDRTERRAFVDAVRGVARVGCIDLRDGDEERYVRGDGDVLYDVHHSHLRHLLAATVPPSVATRRGSLSTDSYADTEKGRRLRIRHHLMRQLCEEPALYHDELSADELAYLRSQRPRLTRELADAFGFVVETRAEGLICLDLDGEATDLVFPEEGTYGHAALLLAEALAGEARSGDTLSVPMARVEEIVGDLLDRYGRYWRAEVREAADGAERLRAEVLWRLDAFGLIELQPTGVLVRPAIARVAADVTEEEPAK